MTSISIAGQLSDVTGTVVTPDDAAYDQQRAVFYGGIDRRPAAIVRVEGVDDIRRVIATAREQGLELAVRSGGHSIVGHSTTDGGLVIDLRAMKQVDVDVAARTAWVETGATAVEVTRALADHGLVLGFGDAGSVGVGGITLGGGIGFLVRKHGMTIDSLLAAELVLADGRHLCVDATRHPDLFWAIRGGGGNFGVVTRLKFAVHPLPEFTGGILVLPASPATIAGFAKASLAAPDDLSTIGNVMPGSALPFLPKEQQGGLVLLAMMAFAGDDASAQRALAPFRALATPLADMVAPGPYVSMYPPEMPDYRPKAIGRTLFLDGLDEATATLIYERLSTSDATMRVAQIRVLGGAMARVPTDATAFAHRSKAMLVNVAAFYEGEADLERRRAWTTSLAKALQPEAAGAYVGFLTDDGEARIHEAYPGATWERLTNIKRQYDPSNVFRRNQNISPSNRSA